VREKNPPGSPIPTIAIIPYFEYIVVTNFLLDARCFQFSTHQSNLALLRGETTLSPTTTNEMHPGCSPPISNSPTGKTAPLMPTLHIIQVAYGTLIMLLYVRVLLIERCAYFLSEPLYEPLVHYCPTVRVCVP